MKLFVWLLRLSVFVLILCVALDNTQLVTFILPGGYVWNSPLISVISVFFVLGILVGILALFSQLLKQRSKLRRLHREIIQLRKKKNLIQILPTETEQPLG